MEDRFNTIAGWVLFAGILALGFSILSSKVFHAGDVEAPEKIGYMVAGGEGEGGGGEEEMPMSMMLANSDVAKGEAVFKKCVACHTINQGGANGIGPNLYGILGKPHAGVAGFAYSDALKSVGASWNFDNMNAWLISPRKYANGTKMTFAGLSSSEDRANVIAYMNAQGSNLPFPAAPAAPAEGEAAPAEGEAAAPAAEGEAAAPAAEGAAPAAVTPAPAG